MNCPLCNFEEIEVIDCNAVNTNQKSEETSTKKAVVFVCKQCGEVWKNIEEQKNENQKKISKENIFPRLPGWILGLAGAIVAIINIINLYSNAHIYPGVPNYILSTFLNPQLFCTAFSIIFSVVGLITYKYAAMFTACILSIIAALFLSANYTLCLVQAIIFVFAYFFMHD